MANKKKIEGIEIANPLYDTVFKFLMENERVSTYFIETFIGEKIESLSLVAVECPVFKWAKKYEKSNITPEDLERLKQLTVIRLDFAATIQTANGEFKKVLIEIQKAKDSADVMRFRHYLAENYKRKDSIIEDNKRQTAPLPIITIYLLGFNLHETEAVAFRVGRSYYDMIDKKAMNVKVTFAEYLTHDSYIVQIGRITGKTKTRLEKILSVFEQRYFINSETKITKNYPHTTDDATVNLMLEILRRAGADPEIRSEIEIEWASYELLNTMVLDKDKKIKELDKALAKEKKARVKEKKTLAEKKKELAKEKENREEKEKELAKEKENREEKEKELAKEKENREEKEKELAEREKELVKEKKAREEDREIIENLQLQLKKLLENSTR